MNVNKITINGQHYDSPEAMPPDVRRMYDEAMRTIAQAPKSGEGDTSQVLTGTFGGIRASVVVNRKITVNDRTYASVDEMPADVRQLYEGALKNAPHAPIVTHARPGFHLSLDVGPRQAGTFGDPGSAPPPPPLPIEPSTTESSLRGLLMSLAVLVFVGLVLWAFLGR